MRVITLLFFTVALFAQSNILDVSTGSRCTAMFLPATAATDVQVDCQSAGKPVLTGAKINIAAITGSTSGVVIGYTVGTESITLLFRRTAAGAQLHLEASVNGALSVSKDVAVP